MEETDVEEVVIALSEVEAEERRVCVEHPIELPLSRYGVGRLHLREVPDQREEAKEIVEARCHVVEELEAPLNDLP